MAKFMYVFRGGAFVEKGLSPAVLQDHLKSWGAWIGELAQQGHQPSGDPVQAGGRTIRGKAKVVTDGPYAELKDLVTGNLVIEVASLDAARCPAEGVEILAMELTTDSPKVWESAREVIGYSMAKNCAQKGRESAI